MTSASDLDVLIAELHTASEADGNSHVADILSRAADALSTAKAQGAEEMRERIAEMADVMADRYDVMVLKGCSEVQAIAYREGEKAATMLVARIRAIPTAPEASL